MLSAQACKRIKLNLNPSTMCVPTEEDAIERGGGRETNGGGRAFKRTYKQEGEAGGVLPAGSLEASVAWECLSNCVVLQVPMPRPSWPNQMKNRSEVLVGQLRCCREDLIEGEGTGEGTGGRAKDRS